MLLCGYDSGALIIFDLYNQSMIKSITDVHNSAVIKCRFWKKDLFNIISTDADETVQLVTLTKLFFTYSYDKQLLV